MTLLKILGIDRYTAKFKEWIRNKFIAKGSLKTINNETIEGEGNIEVQANAEIVWPETIHLNEQQKTNESRVFRAFYNIQNDEFTIIAGVEREPVQAWYVHRAINLGEILNISIIDGDPIVYSCVAKVTQNAPIMNVQFDYLDTHYTLTWIVDTLSWDVTKTPINTGAGSGGSSAAPDWNAQENKVGYIKNRTHYYNEKLQYRGEIEASINNVVTYQLSVYEYIDGLNKAPDKIKFTGGGTSFTLDFIKEPIPGYNDEEGIQETVLKRFTIDSNNDIEVRYYYNGNPEYYEGVIIELDLIATDAGYQEYITFTTEDYYVDLKQIDGIYIPNTVIKTTPQYLSDSDKNQALANLGIDPVVWKYMCNPIFIEAYVNIPADLLEKISSLDDTNYVDYLFLCNIMFVEDSTPKPSRIKTFEYLEDVSVESGGTFRRCLKIYPETTDVSELYINLDTGMVDYIS